MDKTVFIILILVTAVWSVGIFYIHAISNASIPDILGIDSNNDGVRDDAGDYINKKFSEPEERGALMQFAKRLQLQMASYQNPEESNKLSVSSDDSYSDCVQYVFGLDRAIDLEDEIEKIVVNTPSRHRAYDQFNRNLTGGVFGLGGEPSVNDCEFKPDSISTWQTYRNEEFGFEFRYPNNLEVQENKMDTGENEWRIGDINRREADQWLVFDFLILKANKQSLDAFIKKHFDARDILKIETLHSGIYVEFAGLPGFAYFKLYPEKDVAIKFLAGQEYLRSIEFNQILSTFRFIK